MESAYDKTKERIRHREWRVDKILAEHHRRTRQVTGARAKKKAL
nr:hypothetical protein [Burkholderia gladioli]